jgi:hypothetical protein
MSLNNKTIDSLYHQKKLKFYAMMLMRTKNNASPFLLRKKVKILQTDADAHKEKQESLSSEDKDLFVKNNVAAQRKHCKSLSPDQIAQVLTINAAKQKKHQESLSSKQKVKVMTIDVAAHKKQYELLPPEKKLDVWKPELNNIMNI